MAGDAAETRFSRGEGSAQLRHAAPAGNQFLPLRHLGNSVEHQQVHRVQLQPPQTGLHLRLNRPVEFIDLVDRQRDRIEPSALQHILRAPAIGDAQEKRRAS